MTATLATSAFYTVEKSRNQYQSSFHFTFSALDVIESYQNTAPRYFTSFEPDLRCVCVITILHNVYEYNGVVSNRPCPIHTQVYSSLLELVQSILETSRFEICGVFHLWHYQSASLDTADSPVVNTLVTLQIVATKPRSCKHCEYFSSMLSVDAQQVPLFLNTLGIPLTNAGCLTT